MTGGSDMTPTPKTPLEDGRGPKRPARRLPGSSHPRAREATAVDEFDDLLRSQSFDEPAFSTARALAEGYLNGLIQEHVGTLERLAAFTPERLALAIAHSEALKAGGKGGKLRDPMGDHTEDTLPELGGLQLGSLKGTAGREGIDRLENDLALKSQQVQHVSQLSLTIQQLDYQIVVMRAEGQLGLPDDRVTSAVVALSRVRRWGSEPDLRGDDPPILPTCDRHPMARGSEPDLRPMLVGRRRLHVGGLGDPGGAAPGPGFGRSAPTTPTLAVRRGSDVPYLSLGGTPRTSLTDLSILPTASTDEG